jgi:hypothetical protein
MLKISLFLVALLIMLLNIFVFELEKGSYYYVNTAVISLFIAYSYFLDIKKKELSNIQTKILKVITGISILCLVSQTVITFLMPLYRSSDVLIAVFSLLNTLIFITYIFKYEFNNYK